jgi:hypothetical protein
MESFYCFHCFRNMGLPGWFLRRARGSARAVDVALRLYPRSAALTKRQVTETDKLETLPPPSMPVLIATLAIFSAIQFVKG